MFVFNELSHEVNPKTGIYTYTLPDGTNAIRVLSEQGLPDGDPVGFDYVIHSLGEEETLKILAFENASLAVRSVVLLDDVPTWPKSFRVIKHWVFGTQSTHEIEELLFGLSDIQKDGFQLVYSFDPDQKFQLLGDDGDGKTRMIVPFPSGENGRNYLFGSYYAYLADLTQRMIYRS